MKDIYAGTVMRIIDFLCVKNGTYSKNNVQILFLSVCTVIFKDFSKFFETPCIFYNQIIFIAIINQNKNAFVFCATNYKR